MLFLFIVCCFSYIFSYLITLIIIINYTLWRPLDFFVFQKKIYQQKTYSLFNVQFQVFIRLIAGIY